MSQSMEVDHPGTRCGSTHTSQAGVWCWPVALLWSQREGSPGQDAGGVWAAFLCPHMAVILLQAQGMCGYTPWIHSIGTRLLVGNLLVHSGWGWCTSMTPHQGLGVNYTLESRVSVCAAVGPGKTPSLSHCSCSCGERCRAVTLYPHPPGFMAWPGSPRCHGVHGRGGLLPTGWVL